MRKTEFLAAFLLAAALASAQGDAQDPPSRVARLNYLQGNVSFRPGTVDEWTEATLNYPIYNGDHLWADRGARTELHVGSTALRMDSETALAVLNLDDRIVQLSLTGGSLHVRLRSLGDGESFEVDTPNAAITLLRAGEYRFFVDDQQNVTSVTVRAGDAEITGSGRAFTVHARENARLTGDGDTFSSEVLAANSPDDFEYWSENRDRREEQSQSSRYVSREMIGYEDLDSNGSWSEAPDYGWVWTPRVHAGWAPYREGHWVWVEPWGWTWVDDAPWGFAPFHYGRWAYYRSSWVWVPGTVVARPVYAPALVAFVGGPRFSASIAIGGGGGVAWFPLGPHEVYRPAYRVSEVYVRQVNVTHVNVTNINVTNVTYVNQRTPGAVTAVSHDVFVGARPVRQSAVVVDARFVGQAQVIGAAPLAPERVSILGRAQAPSGFAPPQRVVARAVVARATPPPPPVSFSARREALQANPGRPLDVRTVETLRVNDRSQRAPMVRPAPAYQQPRNEPSRVSQPPVQQQQQPVYQRPPDRPMQRQQQQQQQQPQQQPQQQQQTQQPVYQRPDRQPQTQQQQPVYQRPDRQPQQPQQQQQEQRPMPQMRPVERRPVAPPPAAEPQRQEQPRRQVNQEERTERKQERRGEPRKEDKKEEKKQ